jgi:calcineurin-like phosphoesterase family protein/purple acid phosphatase-like protein
MEWLLLSVLALALAGCDLAPPATITGGPYLQQTGPTSTYVVWQTARPLRGAVHYGRRSTAEHVERALGARTMHAVLLRGLSPGTAYVYRVSVAGEITQTFRFRTAEAGPQPFTFAAIGDFGSGSPAELRNAALLDREPLDLVLTLGDNVYPLGTAPEYPRAVFHPLGELMHRLAFWPTLGNHDYGDEERRPSRGTAAAYLRNFVLPQHPGRERFYSFRYANADFLAIDSERSSFAPGSRQYRWIDRTLSRSRACWKIPYFHHPVYPEYVRPPASDRVRQAELVRWLVPLFERHGVKLVLTAHEHNYVRSKPVLSGRPDSRGIVYVVAGGGGAALDPLPANASRVTAVRGRFFHHLLVSVNGRRARVEAIDTSGRVRDQLRLAC